MRRIVLLSLISLAACSRPDGANDNAQATVANESVAAKPAPNADQKAALAVAEAYMQHISKGEYDQAHALWDQGGKASGGSAADLKKAYGGFSSFKGSAGEASEISKASGQEHIIVTASADAVVKRNGEKRDLAGFIYLRRVGAEWRVWGVDVRRKH